MERDPEDRSTSESKAGKAATSKKKTGSAAATQAATCSETPDQKMMLFVSWVFSRPLCPHSGNR